MPRANTVLAQERNSIHSCRINVEMCPPISSRPPFSISTASFRKHTLIVSAFQPVLMVPQPQTPPPSSQAIHGSPSPLTFPSSPIAPVAPPSSSQSTLPIFPDLPLLGYSPSLTPTTKCSPPVSPPHHSPCLLTNHFPIPSLPVPCRQLLP